MTLDPARSRAAFEEARAAYEASVTAGDTPDIRAFGAAIDAISVIIGELAQSFADVLAPTEDAAEMFTVVGMIVIDTDGIESEDGDYWPDAQKVTFTDPEPDPEPVPPMLARRDRLSDWLERSGEVLEVDGSGYTRGGAPGEPPPAWNIPTGQATVRLYPGPPEEDR